MYLFDTETGNRGSFRLTLTTITTGAALTVCSGSGFKETENEHRLKYLLLKDDIMMINHLHHKLRFLLFFSAAVAPQTTALSLTFPQQKAPLKDRPLLRQFNKGINERVLNSKEGCNRFGLDNHYTSAETIPCLDMQTSSSMEYDSNNCAAPFVSSQRDIREAYMANDHTEHGTIAAGEGIHGRSSGSGCCIIRLQGKDATSVRGLVDFADNFFEGIDSDDDDNAHVNNEAARRLKDLGVFRIANNIHAGFDQNVNEEGKMQVLYTKLIPGHSDDEDPILLPLEVGELVGKKILSRAHSGMNTLFDIGSQITSAVLGMDCESTNKLLDDCSRVATITKHEMVSDNHEKIADTMSNSYQRIIRYLKPKPSLLSANGGDDDDAAFWPHVDSTFLTLIPMPEIAGLEVWCPSSEHAKSEDLHERGEWVRPIKPSATSDNTATRMDREANDNDYIHVVALAGEFMQLLSDGQVPTCIHRVIAPKPPSPSAFGFASKKYKPRISAPLFLRPRRGEDAVLCVDSDLRDSGNTGLYFEEGLLAECDSMRIWDYMDSISPDN
jgi:hypothetical protein